MATPEQKRIEHEEKLRKMQGDEFGSEPVLGEPAQPMTAPESLGTSNLLVSSEGVQEIAPDDSGIIDTTPEPEPESDRVSYEVKRQEDGNFSFNVAGDDWSSEESLSPEDAHKKLSQDFPDSNFDWVKEPPGEFTPDTFSAKSWEHAGDFTIGESASYSKGDEGRVFDSNSAAMYEQSERPSWAFRPKPESPKTEQPAAQSQSQQPPQQQRPLARPPRRQQDQQPQQSGKPTSKDVTQNFLRNRYGTASSGRDFLQQRYHAGRGAPDDTLTFEGQQTSVDDKQEQAARPQPSPQQRPSAPSGILASAPPAPSQEDYENPQEPQLGQHPQEGKRRQGVTQNEDLAESLDMAVEQTLRIFDRIASSLESYSQRLAVIESILDRSS